jgi:hypothetical protein
MLIRCQKSAKKAKLTSSELRRNKKDRVARRKRGEEFQDSGWQNSQPSQPSSISDPVAPLDELYSGGSSPPSYRGNPQHPLQRTVQDLLQHPISMVNLHDEQTWYTQEPLDPTASSVSSYTSRSATPTSSSNNPWLNLMAPSVPSSPRHMSGSTIPTSANLKAPPPRLRLAIPRSPHCHSALGRRGLETPINISNTPYEGRSQLKGLPPLQISTSLSAGGSSDASAHSRSMSFGEVQAKNSASSYQATLGSGAQSLTGPVDASGDIIFLGQSTLSSRLRLNQQQHKQQGTTAYNAIFHPTHSQESRLSVGPSSSSTAGISTPSDAAVQSNIRAHESQLNPAANSFQPAGSPILAPEQKARSKGYVAELLTCAPTYLPISERASRARTEIEMAV